MSAVWMFYVNIKKTIKNENFTFYGFMLNSEFILFGNISISISIWVKLFYFKLQFILRKNIGGGEGVQG